ncbi:MAG: hypothetical protein CL596_04880 [Alteromonas sp.]|nr:hypothetical protein [Alteromonas sp.]
MLDYNGRPIARFITSFKYIYDEESDDRCDIEFTVNDPVIFNLPLFYNDVTFKVQWGFKTPTGELYKSPIRLVAVRDLSRDYSEKGTSISLECTDLLAYLKGYKSRTIRNFQNPNANIALETINKGEDNFLDWLKEIVNGQFKATVTHDRTAVKFDLNGGTKVGDYDPIKDTYKNTTRDVTSIPQKFIYQFNARKTIKGKSKALEKAMDDYLKFLAVSSGASGPFMMDGTDDVLSIKQRNFKQESFKDYYWAMGKGNLLSFKPKTESRKVKKDKAINSDVNPYTKEDVLDEINYSDTTENEKNESEQDNIDAEYDKALEQYAKDARDIFLDNVKNPEQQNELPDFSYVKTLSKIDKTKAFYDETRLKPNLKRITIPSITIINTPEFQSIIEEQSSDIKKESLRKQVLTGYTLDKIQRKNEASCSVLGDPTLIKGKVYGFYNLSKRDSGLWYCTTVTHSITTGKGYLCEMDLIKKPRTVGISEIDYKAKRSLLEKEDRLELDSWTEEKQKYAYDSEYLNGEKVLKNNPLESLQDMDNRLETLNASDDFIRDEIDEPITGEGYNEFDKPNNDEM